VEGSPFEVIIPSGVKVTGVVLSDQVKSLDWKIRNFGSDPFFSITNFFEYSPVFLFWSNRL